MQSRASRAKGGAGFSQEAVRQQRSERPRFRDIRSTSIFRLTLLLGIVFFVSVIAMLGLIYGLTEHELMIRDDRIIFRQADSFLSRPAEALPDSIRTQIATTPRGIAYFSLLDANGARLVGNIALGIAPDRIPDNHPFNVRNRVDGHPLRLLAVHTPHGETILVGRDISQLEVLRHRFLIILTVSGSLTVVGVLAAGIVLSRHSLRRVWGLQQASRAIAAGRLETRMPIAGRHDELDQIASTLNLMIEEVGHVIGQVKITTDAIAHDLRTPLTRVRAQLHRLRQSPGLGVEEHEIVARTTEDLDQLLSRFTALLRISELEASQRRTGLAPVDLAGLLGAVAQLYEPLAEDKGVALALAIAIPAVADADEKLLFEALSNLVDNAIKFARAKVILRLARREDGPETAAVIEITDDGPGIAPEEREAVLLRFHRSPDAAGVPGSGLGLSVVSAILHLHGFALELDDAHPGLIARIRL